MQLSRVLGNVAKKLKPENKQTTRLNEYRLIIGLEIHAQLNASVKLFSNSSVGSEQSEPNTHVTPFDAAIPGTLPKLNQEPLSKALSAAAALNFTISRTSSFDRKHYLYYDLPQGYQITQQYNPLAHSGHLALHAHRDDVTRDFAVALPRIQLEQDTGKAHLHTRTPTLTPLVDLNRCGVALVEIVTRPDMHSAEEAVAFVKKLRSTLRAAGVCSGHMEAGNLRADVNVNVEYAATPTIRTARVEVKNLNSLRSMAGAIQYEYERHARALEEGRGDAIQQDTLGWDVQRGATYKLRSKEEAVDYRYMPDPNLREVIVGDEQMASVQEYLQQCAPFLPDALRDRLMQTYALSARDVNVLLAVNEDLWAGDSRRSLGSGGGSASHDHAHVNTQTPKPPSIVRFFEHLAHLSADPQLAVNWTIHELLAQFAARASPFDETTIPAHRLHALLALIQTSQVTSTAAKKVLAHMFDSDKTPATIVDELDLRMLPVHVLDDVVQRTIEDLPDESTKASQGNTKVVRKLIGHAMKVARGKADGSRVEKMLRDRLGIQ
ncbi:hypothetical protein E3P78_01527 [Wallemia ichthyophaga]|nr:hypothetical protein E3P78_01527 [Wallemia ichthyophaga]